MRITRPSFKTSNSPRLIILYPVSFAIFRISHISSTVNILGYSSNIVSYKVVVVAILITSFSKSTIMSRQNFHLIILPLKFYLLCFIGRLRFAKSHSFINPPIHLRSLSLYSVKYDLSQWGVATFRCHRSIGSNRFICRDICRSLIRSWRITQTAISERSLP